MTPVIFTYPPFSLRSHFFFVIDFFSGKSRLHLAINVFVRKSQFNETVMISIQPKPFYELILLQHFFPTCDGQMSDWQMSRRQIKYYVINLTFAKK